MAQRKASSTMMAVAMFKAVHQVLDGEPKFFTDSLAVGLVEGSTREEILAAQKDFPFPNWFRPSSHCEAATQRTASQKLSPRAFRSTCCSARGWIHSLTAS